MSIESILLIRLSAIGDIVMASGVIPALRRKYPDANIDWLVQPECESILTATPELNEVFVWPRKEWISLLRNFKMIRLGQSLTQLVRILRARRYDMVIDMQGLLKSGVWSLLSGGKTRLGLGSKEGSQLIMTDVIRPRKNDKRISSEYKLLLEKLGLDCSDYSIGIRSSQHDVQKVNALLQNYKVVQKYAVICPFTTRPQKHWPEQNWLEFIPQLHAKFGLDVVILGGPGDLVYAKRLEEDSPYSPVNLTGKTSIRESLAIIQQASLVIGVDTGLTHMGMLSNIPTIAIFGSTCPYLETDNDHGMVLYERFSCSPCRRNPSCSDQYPCMQAIDVDKVIRSAERLYST